MTVIIQNKSNVSICTQRVSVEKAYTKSIQYSLKCQSADVYCRHDIKLLFMLWGWLILLPRLLEMYRAFLQEQ